MHRGKETFVILVRTFVVLKKMSVILSGTKNPRISPLQLLVLLH
jgi:hypothetical protein